MIGISIKDTFLYERVLYIVHEGGLYMFVKETETIVLTESPAKA